VTSIADGSTARAPWWESLFQDLRYAVRGLRAKPGFTIAVVLTLGLGIGANAAMFSVVDRLLFRPPPMMRDPALTHRIFLGTTYRGKEFLGNGMPFARYLDLAAWTTSFSRLAQFTRRDLAVGTGSDSREMGIGIASASFFDFFDAPSVTGRYFTAAEDSTPAGTPVAVISYSYWKEAYGGRQDALGSAMRIGPLVYTIIGVAPAGFAGLWPDQPPVAYIPISSYASTQNFHQTGKTWWTTYNWTWSQTIAMRKPGVSIERADADLSSAYVRSYRVEAADNPRNTPIELIKPRAVAASIISSAGRARANCRKSRRGSAAWL